MSTRLRLSVLLALATSLCAVSAAGATPMRPALSTLPFTQISDAAARAAHDSPVCPNGFVCYAPRFLQQAYDFPSGHGAPTGAGQTIVIVVAYGSPTIAADLAQFDAENGLPAPPSFTTLTQQVPVSSDGSGDLTSWAIETSLDVEYAHALAPGAAIVLAVADTDDSPNFAEIEREALGTYPSAIVTQSFGMDETGDFSDQATETALQGLYLAQVLHGGTVLAASGDFGASNLTVFGPSPAAMAAFPASSPLVLAVGGTEGNPYPGGLWRFPGKYGGEQVWNEVLASGAAGASGGAASVVFPAPAWQRGVTGNAMRAEPDVAYNAANDGGVIVVLGGKHGVVGGTSAGPPQWAAIVALANELRGKQGRPPLGLATPQLYALAQDSHSYRKDFNDITSGNNALGGDPTQLPGFSAGPGYDLPTGLGTPDVGWLLRDLADQDGRRFRTDDVPGPRPGHGRGHVRFHPGD